MIGPESKLRRNPEVVARDLADGEGAVLLRISRGQYHGVNPVGLAIWALIDESSTVAEVVERLRHRVEDTPPNLDDDVLKFLTSVHERALVLVAP